MTDGEHRSCNMHILYYRSVRQVVPHTAPGEKESVRPLYLGFPHVLMQRGLGLWLQQTIGHLDLPPQLPVLLLQPFHPLPKRGDHRIFGGV
jgi:hypothetical protein